MMGWNSKPEIFHEDKTHESQKKRLKIIFLLFSSWWKYNLIFYNFFLQILRKTFKQNSIN